MTPIRLSDTWYRRFYGVAFTLSFLVVAIYLLIHLEVIAATGLPTLDIIAVSLAGVTAIASLALFITVKKTSASTTPAVAVFLLAAATIAYSAYISGEATSPFVALWPIIAFMSPIFGAIGWLFIVVITGALAASSYIDGTSFTNGELLFIAITSIVPLIAGFIAWYNAFNNTEHRGSHEVKHLASQLSEVAIKSEIIINAIGDGVIAIDSKGVVQLINPAAQKILGWGKQDALLLNYKSILQLTDDNNHEIDITADPLQQVLNTNQSARSNKLNSVTRSGKKIAIAIVVSPIGDAGSGAIAVFRDVTNERAEEREQAEFISTASHEMRTPVASIEGYLGLALNPNTAQIDDKARDFITKAHESAQHLGRLFQDLLDVAKSEDGRMTQVPKVVEMVQYTQLITEGLIPKATEKGLRIVFKPGDASTQRKIMPVYFVNQDIDHIREIISNLIENAIKYTPQGVVSVDVTGSEERVVISVTDTGLGIPAEDIPHLFQKFYRVENADRQSIGGTGLGLYLSRRIAESMQGRLWVESTFGEGSTFFFELPRISGQEAELLKNTQEAQAAQQVPASVPAPAPFIPAPPAAQSQPQQLPQTPALNRTAIQPATTVPRGESLTKEQIAERVRQLEAFATQQREHAQKQQ